MTKILMTLAVVCLCAAPAFADNGTPSANTLDAMGLSSIQVMSDNDALAVRGLGFTSRRHRGPSVAAWGNSEAEVEVPGFEAESENGYRAYGSHFADGSNESYASITKVKTMIESIGPDYTHTKQMIKSTAVVAGGMSWAKAL